jgi:hypothetical protein
MQGARQTRMQTRGAQRAAPCQARIAGAALLLLRQASPPAPIHESYLQILSYKFIQVCCVDLWARPGPRATVCVHLLDARASSPTWLTSLDCATDVWFRVWWIQRAPSPIWGAFSQISCLLPFLACFFLKWGVFDIAIVPSFISKQQRGLQALIRPHQARHTRCLTHTLH